jgi:hypothetical protein
MTQFVGQHRIEFICAQALEESILDGEPETSTSLAWRFHRNDERNLRLDRDVDIVGDPQLFSQTIDDELNAFGEKRGWLRCRCDHDQTRDCEEEDRAGRRQHDPRR